MLKIKNYSSVFVQIILCGIFSDYACAAENGYGIDFGRLYGDRDIFQMKNLPNLGSFIPNSKTLEARGATIGQIVIYGENVFNTRNPKEGNVMFQLANKLHMVTKESVILDHLLFKSGDQFSRLVLLETERSLRSLDYLYDARIFPIAYQDGLVDIAVITRDVWTLSFYLDYSREGGVNKSQVGIKESNLFGYGNEIQFDRRRSIDREQNRFFFKDDNINGSRNNILFEYSDNSDGEESRLNYERPFYSLSSVSGHGVELHSFDQIEKRFTGGEEIDQYLHSHSESTLFAGFSKGLFYDSTTRWKAGFTYLEDRYKPNQQFESNFPLPEDSRLSYPWLSMDVVQNKYEIARRLYKSGGVEDVNLGSTANVKIGVLTNELGSKSDGVIYETAYNSGFKLAEKDYLFVKLSGNGRVEGDKNRDLILSVGLDYFKQISRVQTYLLKLQLRNASHFSNQDLFTLGGDTGLRGYPLRYQAGNKYGLLNIEGHYFSDYHLFQIFRVGGVIFFDVGRVWDADVANNPVPGILKGVGFGLRLVSTRSTGKKVLHIDVAYPLDGDPSIENVQYSIEAQQNF